MATFLIITSCLLWAAALATLPRLPLFSPALSYLGLLTISFATHQGYPILPINTIILMGWLCMTVVVMLATIMQPRPVSASTHGMGYIIGGALTGMATGLLGFSFTSSPGMLYGIMIAATAAGVYFGFLMYSRTPAGASFAPARGNFFRYLLAKGFPAAITVMQIGVVLVLTLAIYNNPSSL